MKLLSFILLGLLLFASSAVPQTDRDLLDSQTRDILRSALNGERAKEDVAQITRYHRIQGSRQYKLAARYVLDQLRQSGYTPQEAFIESFPSDGRISYQTWQSPSGWDITSADLEMVEPRPEKLVSFPDIPMSVITYSNPGDVTADLVWVGAGTNDSDYVGKKVKGKIVLATGYGGEVHRLAVLKYEAKAVVCYLDDERSREHPDMVQYTGMWPRTDELGKVRFGFNISRRQGEELRRLLESGKKVVLHGRVRGTGLEPDSMQVVVALLRGSSRPEEEIVLSAHLDHPKQSANDNASGSAAILDIARGLQQAISEKRLPAPQRTIRFLWVPEWYGTMAYIDAHPELKGPALGGKVLADLNLDMVGENEEVLHSKLIMTRTPASLPSCVNDVVANMAGMVDRMTITTPHGSHSAFNYRIVPYSGGSDHMMFIDRKIPGIMFSHEPDYTHHTSDDTVGMVDPVELERSELIAAGTAVYLASLTPEQGYDLLFLLRGKSAERLAPLARRNRPYLNSVSIADLPIAWAECENANNYTLQQEIDCGMSVLQFATSDRLQHFADLTRPHIARDFEYLYSEARDEVNANGYASDSPPFLPAKPDSIVPIRLTRGPLDFGLPESKLSAKEAAWYHSKDFSLTPDERFELVNFIDGRRTAADLRNALSAEFRPIDMAVVSRYVRDLIKVGVLGTK